MAVNLATRSYQYYDGRAFHDNPDFYDFSQRKGYIENNLISALNTLKTKAKFDSSKPVLNGAFIKKLYKLAKESFKKEQVLFKSIDIGKIDFPEKNKESIDNYLETIKQIVLPELKKAFRCLDELSINSNALEFLAVLQSSDFLRQLANSKTILSFEKYGKQFTEKGAPRTASRPIGKQSLSRILTDVTTYSSVTQEKAPKHTLKNYQTLVNFIFEDFMASLVEKEMLAGIEEIVLDTIRELLMEVLDQEISIYLGKMGKRMFEGKTKKSSSQLLAEIMSKKEKSEWEKFIKDFYKNVYRELIGKINTQQVLKINGTTIFLQIEQNFLGGALNLKQPFGTTTWGTNITALVYDEYDETTRKFGDRKENINKVEVLKEILNIIAETLQTLSTLGKNEIKKLAQDGLIFLQSNRDFCLKKMSTLVSEMSDKDFAQWIGAFSVERISSLIGELINSIFITEKFHAIIIGTENYGKGEIPVDMKLVVIAKNGHRVSLGLQIKHYKDNPNFTLYSGTKIDVFESQYYNYLNQEDGRLLRFILVNEKILKDKFHITIDTDTYNNFLKNFIAEFIRYKPILEGGNYGLDFKNNFYAINADVIPTSYILLQIISKAYDIIDKAKKNKKEEIFSLIKEGDINYLKVNPFTGLGKARTDQIEGHRQKEDIEQRADFSIYGRWYYNMDPTNIEITNKKNLGIIPYHVNNNSSIFKQKRWIQFNGIYVDIN